MSSKNTILSKLRTGRQQLAGTELPTERLHMTPLVDRDQTTLIDRFIHEAELLSAVVYRPKSDSSATSVIMQLLRNDKTVAAWQFDQIGLPALERVLDAADVTIAAENDASVRVGITGATAALAVTGSLVLPSGAGRPRATSLLPPVHIAVVREGMISADFETWISQQYTAGLDHFRQSSNIIVISGASRTGDIAMELILGMHGPKELHIILLPDLLDG